CSTCSATRGTGPRNGCPWRDAWDGAFGWTRLVWRPRRSPAGCAGTPSGSAGNSRTSSLLENEHLDECRIVAADVVRVDAGQDAFRGKLREPTELGGIAHHELHLCGPHEVRDRDVGAPLVRGPAGERREIEEQVHGEDEERAVLEESARGLERAR